MSLKPLPAWVPYCAPFALFLLLTTLEGHFSLAVFPVVYAVKIAIVGGLLIALRRHFPEARPGGSGWVPAAALGLILIFVWITVDKHTPHFAFLGTRTAYNPAMELGSTAAVVAFLAVRFLGLVIVTPLIEELFYRGFLLRYATNPDDFGAVPMGTFSLVALLINVVLFALSHPEWLAAAIFALAMCLLLRFTKNLFACILAHGVTNLLLGVYVLHTGQWQYW